MIKNLKSTMEKISIIIPIHNEEGNISELYDRLTAVLQKDFSVLNHEILFVDDGSTDSSYDGLEKLHRKDSNVKVIKFSRNFGHHLAITAGLDHATGDYVVMMDGDLQDQPEEIIKLYRRIKEGYDVVYGERIKKRFSFFKRLCSKVFLFILRNLIDEKIVINTTIFRMLRKPVVDAVKNLRETNRYVIGLIGWVGFKHASVPVLHGVRQHGKTKYNFRRQLQLAFNAIFSFSDYPLRIIIRAGLVLVCFSFSLGFYVLFKKWLYGVPIMGWTSVIASILFVGGSQILFLGVIGQYVGRSYIEVKQRVLYVVEKFLNEK